MSELKAIKIELNNHGKPIASIQGTTSYYGISPNDTFYSQEEADKVIAELKAENERLGGESCKLTDGCLRLKQCRKEKANLADELRHHKYKRCLAMAEMCKARYDEEDAKVNGCGASWEYISKEMKYWERWRWRWLALTEEPTWAKFLQLIHKEAK